MANKIINELVKLNPVRYHESSFAKGSVVPVNTCQRHYLAADGVKAW